MWMECVDEMCGWDAIWNRLSLRWVHIMVSGVLCLVSCRVRVSYLSCLVGVLFLVGRGCGCGRGQGIGLKALVPRQGLGSNATETQQTARIGEWREGGEREGPPWQWQ